MPATGTLPPELAARLDDDDVAAAIVAWADDARVIIPEQWVDRTATIDAEEARLHLVDVERDGQVLRLTLGLDHDEVVNLGCSVHRTPVRVWLRLVIERATGAWRVERRFATTEEPEI